MLNLLSVLNRNIHHKPRQSELSAEQRDLVGGTNLIPFKIRLNHIEALRKTQSKYQVYLNHKQSKEGLETSTLPDLFFKTGVPLTLNRSSVLSCFFRSLGNCRRQGHVQDVQDLFDFDSTPHFGSYSGQELLLSIESTEMQPRSTLPIGQDTLSDNCPRLGTVYR